MSKEKTDPKQKIALQKMLVGHYIETIPEDCKKKVIYVLQGDGLYEKRINKLGSFCLRVAKLDVPGLETNLNEGWELDVPKIPAALLGTTVSFFRKIYSQHSSEVFLQFYYDVKENEYLVHCPKQTVGAASVKYENDEYFTDESKILVFEIHSHGQMGAFFSGTDDRDEKADRFFGVIGNINHFFPELKLRLSVGGNKVEIDVEDLFDLDEEMYHSAEFPAEWIDNIKKAKIKKVKDFGRPFGLKRDQMEMWKKDPELAALMAKYSSEDYLYDKEKKSNGYYVQEGDELYFVENGEKCPVEVEETNALDDDPYDWRKYKF